MPSLQEVIERACADGAFEVVIESGQCVVTSSPTGRLNAGMPVSEDDIHAMLDRFLSPDQHVELALGQPIAFDLPLRGEKGAWRVVVESLAEGSVVRVTAPARPRSTGEFAAKDLRRQSANRDVVPEPTRPAASARQSAVPRPVSSAIHDELDIELEFDDQPAFRAERQPENEPEYKPEYKPEFKPDTKSDRKPVASQPARLSRGGARGAGVGVSDDLAFDEMFVEDDASHSLASLGPLDGEEEFRESLRPPSDSAVPSPHIPDDDEQFDGHERPLGLAANDDGAWGDSADEDFAIPGVGSFDAEQSRTGHGMARGLGVPVRSWEDFAADPTPTAGVPAYIPEPDGYTPHAGLDFEAELRAASSTRRSTALEFELSPPESDPAPEGLDALVRESTLVIALEEEAAAMVREGLSTPSLTIDDLDFEPRALTAALARLPRGGCIVLDLEDPSIALGWLLRRMEQGFRVVVIARAVTMEGAQRMMLGTQSNLAARQWLAAHETFGVSYERSALAWRALAWEAAQHAA